MNSASARVCVCGGSGGKVRVGFVRFGGGVWVGCCGLACVWAGRGVGVGGCTLVSGCGRLYLGEWVWAGAPW